MRKKFFVVLRRKDGTASVSEPRKPCKPDHHGTNGFDAIEPYVSRLLAPSKKFKSVMIFSDSKRGFLLFSRNGQIEASFILQRWHRGAREAAVRTFFSSLDIEPSFDYLAPNGGVPDITRHLRYPIHGAVSGVTTLTKRILSELFDISPTDALDITYEENSSSSPPDTDPRSS